MGSDELVERLELVAAWHTPAGRTPKMPRPPIHTTCRQAVEAIRSLTAQLAEARESERAAVVAWLRAGAGQNTQNLDRSTKALFLRGLHSYASAIEAGEHIQHDRHD